MMISPEIDIFNRLYLLVNQLIGLVFTNSLGNLGSISGHVIPKP